MGPGLVVNHDSQARDSTFDIRRDESPGAWALISPARPRTVPARPRAEAVAAGHLTIYCTRGTSSASGRRRAELDIIFSFQKLTRALIYISLVFNRLPSFGRAPSLHASHLGGWSVLSRAASGTLSRVDTWPTLERWPRFWRCPIQEQVQVSRVARDPSQVLQALGISLLPDATNNLS